MLESRVVSCTALGKMRITSRLVGGRGAGVIFRPGLQVPPPSIERSFSSAKPTRLDSEMIVFHTMASMHLPRNHPLDGVRSRLAACVSYGWARVQCLIRCPGSCLLLDPSPLCLLPLAVGLRCLYCIYFQISFQTYLWEQCLHQRCPVLPMVSTAMIFQPTTQTQSCRLVPTEY
jgi:hypothetical protein